MTKVTVGLERLAIAAAIPSASHPAGRGFALAASPAPPRSPGSAVPASRAQARSARCGCGGRRSSSPSPHSPQSVPPTPPTSLFPFRGPAETSAANRSSTVLPCWVRRESPLLVHTIFENGLGGSLLSPPSRGENYDNQQKNSAVNRTQDALLSRRRSACSGGQRSGRSQQHGEPIAETLERSQVCELCGCGVRLSIALRLHITRKRRSPVGEPRLQATPIPTTSAVRSFDWAADQFTSTAPKEREPSRVPLETVSADSALPSSRAHVNPRPTAVNAGNSAGRSSSARPQSRCCL